MDNKHSITINITLKDLDKEQLEVTVQSGEERKRLTCNEKNPSNVMDEVEQNQKPDHQSDRAFTEKLRKLMKDNPDLVVKLSFGCDMDNENLDCSVANIQNHKNGKFREKVILIHSKSESFPLMVSDDSIELPFR